MTQTNVDKLDAGPLLDAMIARRVMDLPERTLDDPCPYREYSTSIEGAWQVLEKMRARGFALCVLTTAKGYLVTVTVLSYGEYCGMEIRQETAASAPLAICRAALAALEATP